jgi:glycosyltransferase involved in cell wall biosynthesis
MKLVLAHDFVRHGGAEKVLDEMHGLWPDAPIHTLLAEELPRYEGWPIRSSWLQGKVPPAKYRWPLPLFQGMVDRLPKKIDWDGVDLLMSSSVSFMKSLEAPAGIPHLCYIHRPAMFAYDRQDMFLSGYPRILHPPLRAVVKRFKRWDQRHKAAPDMYVANSKHIAGKVYEAYGQDARVLYPPVDGEPFRKAAEGVVPGDYYFTALRIEGYKRVDLVVDACERLGLPLKVAGTGPLLEQFRKSAGPATEFLGFVSDDEMYSLMAGSRGFVFPPEEDFGIAPVEALAAGRPVVALGKAGTAETVIDGESGIHFPEQRLEDVVTAIRRCEEISWDPAVLQAQAEKFSIAAFRDGLVALAEEAAAL